MTLARSRARRRLDWRLTSICTFANLDGALFVFLYLVLVAPLGRPPEGWWPDVIAFVAFVVVAFGLEAWWSTVSWNRALGWLAEDRSPTDSERAATLHLPLGEAARSFVAWAVAAVFFSLFCVIVDGLGRQALYLGLTIIDGGLVSCAVLYLLFERALRNVFADVLAAAPPPGSSTVGVGPRLMLTWTLGSAVPLSGLVVLPFISNRQSLTGAVVAIAGAGLCIGMLTTLVAARSVADPLRALRDAIAEVADGQLDVAVRVDDAGEVGLLQSGVNHMVAGLRERHRLADLFGRHVGTEVARRALEQGSGLMSEQRDATAMFVDLVGSTALAEVLAPEAVVDTLNAFFDAVTRAVGAQGGWVNKFQGDGALCILGAPAVQPDHAARALRAACVLHAQLPALAVTHPGIDAGIGISSGTVVAGNVGTEQRYEYTIIGGPVNEAARLTDLAKARPGRVLASAAALERATDQAPHWSALGTVAIRGRAKPTEIYEPAVEERATGRT